MKTNEVLRRYAEGERDFRRVNLRGKSLKEQDLRGADFSEADIQSTDFTGANLREANFTGAKCGLQRRWLAFVIGLSWLLWGISAFGLLRLSTFVIQALVSGWEGQILSLLILTSVFLFFFVTINRTEGDLAAGAGFTLGIVGAIGLILALVTEFSVNDFLNYLGVLIGVFAIAGGTAIACSVIFVIVKIFGLILIGVFALTEVLAVNFLPINGLAKALTIILVLGFTLHSSFIAWLALKQNKQSPSAWLLNLAMALAAMGGTSFRGANLKKASFTGAKLKSTDLRKATLTHVRWYGAKMLDRVRPGNTYLKNSQLQQWLIGKGKDKNFDGQKLRGINLQGANLTDASFIGADLSQANLQDADLSRAKLVQTQLDGTDLTGVTLTGACIEDWGITVDTVLDGVKCDYIFTRLPTKEDPNPQRKPDNWSEVFEGDELADFIKPIQDTLDLYHNQDIDPRVLAIAWKQLAENNPDGELEIVAMENRGEDKLLLRIKTNPEADKSKLSAEYFYIYNDLKALTQEELEKLLTEKDEPIQALEIMVNTALKRPSFYTEKYQGDISSTVANTINQLPAFENEPDKQELKQLLNQLHPVVMEAELEGEEIEESLEQIKALAQCLAKSEIANSLTNSQDGAMKKTAKRAMRVLQGIATALPQRSAMVTICNQLHELIGKIF